MELLGPLWDRHTPLTVMCSEAPVLRLRLGLSEGREVCGNMMGDQMSALARVGWAETQQGRLSFFLVFIPLSRLWSSALLEGIGL